MKTKLKLLLVPILVFSFSLVQAQEECEVLHENLKGEYRGECRRGLAHGYGEAQGKDHYIGDFKRGYPDGKGIYTWSAGERYRGEWKNGMRHGEGTYYFFADGQDTVISGKWIDDRYVGVYHERPYNVDYRNNVGRVTFTKISSDRYYVRLKFMRHGGENTNISELLLFGSSGSENTSRMFTGFENTEFPFQSKVSFNAPNSFYAASMRCEVRFQIFEPGAWVVSINY
ncbi:MAG: hypothetical protein KFF49_09160 [Bacteroidales bacterium]|nr:hypothetical protein [Bacteroidales bacterium]